MSLDEDLNNAEDENVEEDAADAERRSGWSTASEIASGFLALFLVAVGVLVLYLAGGVAVGMFARLLTTAAPAIVAVGAALFLARYLSRR